MYLLFLLQRKSAQLSWICIFSTDFKASLTKYELQILNLAEKLLSFQKFQYNTESYIKPLYSSKWRTFKKQESGSTYVELLMMSQKNQDSNADGILNVAPLFKNTQIGTSCNTNIGHRFYGHKTTNGPWSSLPIIINALLHPLLFVVYSFLMTSQLDRCCFSYPLPYQGPC